MKSDEVWTNDKGVQSPIQKSIARVVNGAIAGVVGTSAVFPLDFSKTRLQQQTRAGSGSLAYRNMFDCMVKVARSEGILGLYRGLPINLALVMPEKAIKLAVNDEMRHYFGSRNGSVLPIYKEMIAGGASGMFQVVVTTPMEFLKIQLQMGSKAKEANGPAQTSALRMALQLIKKDGFSSVYRGFQSTLLRDVTFSLMYFPGFAFLNNYGYGPAGEKPQFYHTLASGLLAGCVSSFAVTPLDVIKTRLQYIDHLQNKPAYTGLIDCIRKTYVSDGLRAFFRGSLARVMVIAPLFGIAQTVYFLGIAEKLIGIPH